MSDPFADDFADDFSAPAPPKAVPAAPAPAPEISVAAPVDAFADLPHDQDAEQALLGTLLLHNDAFDRVAEQLREEHFVHPLHRTVFAAVRNLLGNHRPATPITLRPLLQSHAAFTDGKLRVSDYLAQLIENAVSPATAADYARIIYDTSIARELMALADDIRRRASGKHEEIERVPAIEQIVMAEHALFTLAETGQAERGPVNFRQALTMTVKQTEAALRRGGGMAGVATRLTDLDRKLGGLHPSDLVILAGRPSMGKTALAGNIAFNAAIGGPAVMPDGRSVEVAPVPTVFFSLEMSTEQLVSRILSEQTEIPAENLRRGRLSDDEFQQLVSAAGQFESAPMFIDDTPALSVSSLASRCRRLKRKHDLGLVVIDYLQLLRPPAGMRKSNENRVQELSDITQSLKALAKELQVPVLALSQLSRAVESRDDKRPQLSDLRESGSIEQDADAVLFVFREEYYLGRKEPREGSPEHLKWEQEMNEVRGLAEVIIGKQRHGPIGTVRLHFRADLTRFGNLADGDRYPEHEH